MATRLKSGLTRASVLCGLYFFFQDIVTIQNSEFRTSGNQVRFLGTGAMEARTEGCISASGHSGKRSRRTRTVLGAGPHELLGWRCHCQGDREPETAHEDQALCRLARALVMKLASLRWRCWRGCSGQGAAEWSGGCCQHQPNCLTEEREHAEGPDFHLSWRRTQKLHRLD